MATADPYETPIFNWRTPASADDDWYTEQASMLSCIDADVASVWSSVSATSGYWNSAFSAVSANSGYWDSAHKTVSAASAAWGQNGVADTPVWSASEIAFDSGWFLPTTNIANTHRFAHGLGSEPDMVFLWAKANDYIVGESIFTGLWGWGAGNHGVRIIEINSTNIAVHGADSEIHWRRASKQGATTGCKSYGPEYRILAIDKTPDYDSGWGSLSGYSSGEQVTVPHGMGDVPDIYTLELATDAGGTGNRGYSMIGTLEREGGLRTVVVDVNSTNIIFSISTSDQYHFFDYDNVEHDYDTGLGVPIVSVWYRVKAWSWTPDYDSGWNAIGNTSNTHLLLHNLNSIPYLYLLEFSKANDGSDDIVPMMGTPVTDIGAGVEYDYGMHLQHLGQKTATVSYGHVSHNIANYEDSGGTYQNCVDGYFRLKLWV